MAYCSVLCESIENAYDTVVRFGNKVCFEIESNVWEIERILYYEANREALTVLCSVIKHLGSGWSTQEIGRNTRLRLVFLPTLLSCSNRFLRALQQNRAHSRLLYLLIKGRLGRQFCIILVMKVKCKFPS